MMFPHSRKIRAPFVFAAIIGMTLLGFGARPAQASLADFWHQIFPEEDTGPKPEQTLVAPFADKSTPVSTDELYKQTAQPGSDDLSQPHRQPAEIGEWLTRAVPEIFEVKPADYDAHLQHLGTGMNEAALAQYKTFMQNSNILKTLADQHLELHAFVEEPPVQLNAQALDGRFRWLFEMPVTLTFLSDTVKSYDQGGVTPINQHVLVRLQVGRMPQGQGLDEMEIESFDVRQNTDEPQTTNP